MDEDTKLRKNSSKLIQTLSKQIDEIKEKTSKVNKIITLCSRDHSYLKAIFALLFLIVDDLDLFKEENFFSHEQYENLLLTFTNKQLEIIDKYVDKRMEELVERSETHVEELVNDHKPLEQN